MGRVDPERLRGPPDPRVHAVGADGAIACGVRHFRGSRALGPASPNRESLVDCQECRAALGWAATRSVAWDPAGQTSLPTEPVETSGRVKVKIAPKIGGGYEVSVSSAAGVEFLIGADVVRLFDFRKPD